MAERKCMHCGSGFSLSSADLDLLEQLGPKVAGNIIALPLPTRCPRCRLQRRLAFRNQIYLKRSADGEPGPRFSMYLGRPWFPVISNEDWWDENGWNPLDYGKEFDFNRPFFVQWQELRNQVPRPAMNVDKPTVINSNYSNNAHYLKNCYFVFDANTTQDAFYLETAIGCRDSIDCSYLIDSELCYDCAACDNCYRVQSATHCSDCTNSFYLFNCRSCESCFGCVNLRRRKHCVFNQQYSERDYNRFIFDFAAASYQTRLETAKRFQTLAAQLEMPHLFGKQLENCSGNVIAHAKDVAESFFVREAERIRYCQLVGGQTVSCMDFTIWGKGAELVYESVVCGNGVFNIAFCFNCWNGASDLLYCDGCHGARHCFGCIGLKKREFHILNKPYTKDQYERMVPMIIEHMRRTGEWGEFFPMQMAPVPYNVSLAQRYFPLNMPQCETQGLQWSDIEGPRDSGVHPESLPDELPEADRSLVALSQESRRPFLITAQEIRLLRRLGAPLPRLTYDERMNARMLRIGGLRLFQRQCGRTGKALLTVHRPEDVRTVIDRETLENELC